MAQTKGSKAFTERMAKERAEMAASVVSSYHRGLGHKSIAKELGFSPRRVRTVLIEQGVYKPGKIQGSKSHIERAQAWTKCPKRKADAMKKLRAGLDQWMAERTAFNEDMRQQRKVSSAYDRMCQRQGRPAGETPTERYARQYSTCPQFRLRALMRSRINKFIKRGTRTPRTLKLLGCTLPEFKAHIEQQFTKGMTWENNGIGRGKWNLDHIAPCASFNLTIESEQARCFHYTNLKPMWSIANIKKGKRTPKAHQWLLI